MASVKAPFFDLREAKNGQPYLVITQTGVGDKGKAGQRASVVIFPGHLPFLMKAVKELVACFEQRLSVQVDKLAAAGEKIKGQRPSSEA